MAKRTSLTDRLLPDYTSGEEIMNMVSHIVGGAIGVASFVLCVVFAAIHKDGYAIASAIVVSTLIKGIALSTLSFITFFISTISLSVISFFISKNTPLSIECLILISVFFPNTSIAEVLNSTVNPFSYILLPSLVILYHNFLYLKELFATSTFITRFIILFITYTSIYYINYIIILNFMIEKSMFSFYI